MTAESAKIVCGNYVRKVVKKTEIYEKFSTDKNLQNYLLFALKRAEKL